MKIYIIIERTWNVGKMYGAFLNKNKAQEKAKWVKENTDLPETILETINYWTTTKEDVLRHICVEEIELEE